MRALGDDGAVAFGSVKDGIGARVQARDCSSGGQRRAAWIGRPRKRKRLAREEWLLAHESWWLARKQGRFVRKRLPLARE